jgi:hypothetical protein
MSEKPVIEQTSFLICGPHSSGKTLLTAQLADYVEKMSGGKQHTRLYSCDRGGYSNLQSRIDKGTLKAKTLIGVKHPFETLEQASRCWWEEEDGVWKPPTEKTWQEVGARVYEGVLSFSTALKQTLTANIEAGKISVDPNAASKYERPSVHFKDGSTQVTGMPTTLYGTVYSRLELMLNASMSYPGICVWTSQEKEIDDPKGNAIAVGPATEGQKLISILPSWFRHTLWLNNSEAKRSTAGTVEQQYRAYIKQHNHPTLVTVPYIGKLRLGANINPCDVPKYLVNDPMGVFGPPTPNIFETIFNLLAGKLPAVKK